MAAIIPVTAALIRRGDHILIAQRKPDAHQGGLWEFPGGKLQFGEEPEAGLRREIREELDLDIQVGDIFTVVSHVYGDRHILLLAYWCTPEPGREPRPVEVGDLAWVRPEEMSQYHFAPADIPIVARLQGFATRT
jgi:8-oxo-dGTP diphosphatase